MRYYLTAVSGMHKGRLWSVDDKGLLLGRDASCDICLFDPVVSRHQCRVLVRDGQAWLEDAGARNPALVNGAAIKTGLLKAGDTLALGQNQFLIADVAAAEAPPEAGKSHAPTAAWDKDSPVLLNIQDAREQVDLRPNSVSDLVYLYDLTRELSRQPTLASFFDALRRQVATRFRPSDCRIAFPYDNKGITFHDMAVAPTDGPGRVMADVARECLDEGQGILRPGAMEDGGVRQRLFTMAAPLTAGEQRLGALVLQTHTPKGVFDEDDLKLLVLLAGSAGLILYAVEHGEFLSRDNERLRALSGESDTLIGASRALGHARAQLREAAKTRLNVLITGETGTGKELAARAIHRQSAQRTKPFVVVNCAAIPRDLFESTLFGHVKGAFTGATADTPGLLALAHGGILFLDEVGDLSLDNQARILRVVEEGVFRPVGGQAEVRLHIRVVAATNHNLEARIAEGLFRADLFHRLSGCQIHMPPLREHMQDIPTLVLHFIEQARVWGKRPITGIAPEALEALRDRSWPGNVRELRNCVLRAVAVSRNEVLQARDFPALPAEGVPTGDAALLSLAEVEKRHIKAVIDHYRGNLKAAAEHLQIARSTLYNKISEYDIE